MRTVCIVCILLLWPTLAFAKQETVWDFTKGMHGQWQFSDCTNGEHTDHGLYVYAEQPCRFVRTIDLDHPVDTVTLTLHSPRRVRAVFLWHARKDPPSYMVNLPFVIPEHDGVLTIELNPSSFPEWDPQTDRIGFVLQHKGELLIEDIRLTHWNLFEKAREAFFSFWKFDKFRPYSINFLWGPVIGLNPVWRAEIFEGPPPPRGWYSGYVFYPLILLAGIASVIIYQRTRRTHHAIGVFILCLTCLWLLFDLRMGTELLSYVRTDWQQFILATPEQKRFRAFDDFLSVYEKAFPSLKDAETYGIAPTYGSPFASLATYITYPHTVLTPEAVLQHGPPTHSPMTWLVYNRNDVRIDEENHLIWIKEDGIHRLSKPGEVVEIFSDNSFLFKELPAGIPSP